MRIAFFVVMVLVLSTTPAFADCTREQAFNKMMALDPVSKQLQREWKQQTHTNPIEANAKTTRLAEFTSRFGNAGSLLQQEKYNEACAIYNQLAGEYGVSFADAKTPTMKQIERERRRTMGGECDLAEAARRASALTDSFHSKYPPGTVTAKLQRDFSEQMSIVGTSMSSDPAKACGHIEEAKRKLGLE